MISYLFGYWWKDGKSYELDNSSQIHIQYVVEHPDVFGIDIDEWISEHGELDEDGYITDYTNSGSDLMEYLYSLGWIRVRTTEFGSTIECYNSNTQDFMDCAWFVYSEMKKRHFDEFAIEVNSTVGKYKGEYLEDEIPRYLLNSRRPIMNHKLTEKEIMNSLIVSEYENIDAINLKLNRDRAKTVTDKSYSVCRGSTENTIHIATSLEKAENMISKIGKIISKEETTENDETIIAYKVETANGIETYFVV